MVQKIKDSVSEALLIFNVGCFPDFFHHTLWDIPSRLQDDDDFVIWGGGAAFQSR